MEPTIAYRPVNTNEVGLHANVRKPNHLEPATMLDPTPGESACFLAADSCLVPDMVDKLNHVS